MAKIYSNTSTTRQLKSQLNQYNKKAPVSINDRVLEIPVNQWSNTHSMTNDKNEEPSFQDEDKKNQEPEMEDQ